MTLAAYATTGFAVAGIHAWMLRRDRDSSFHRAALHLALLVAVPAALLQLVSGDISAKFVAEYQPAKRLKLMTSKSANPIRFGRLLEQQPDWVWATVEPLDIGAPVPAIVAGEIPPAAANE